MQESNKCQPVNMSTENLHKRLHRLGPIYTTRSTSDISKTAYLSSPEAFYTARTQAKLKSSPSLIKRSLFTRRKASLPSKNKSGSVEKLKIPVTPHIEKVMLTPADRSNSLPPDIGKPPWTTDKSSIRRKRLSMRGRLRGDLTACFLPVKNANDGSASDNDSGM